MEIKLLWLNAKVYRFAFGWVRMFYFAIENLVLYARSETIGYAIKC
jgi:hypothetical protein